MVLAPAILLRSVDNWHEQEPVLGDTLRRPECLRWAVFDELRQAHMCIITHG